MSNLFEYKIKQAEDIIVLLILAEISIGMLFGDNGVLRQAGNAKTQNDIAQEKEILEQAAILAMGTSKYGNLEKEKLDKELEKYSEVDKTEEDLDGVLVTFKSNRKYLVNINGDIEQLKSENEDGFYIGDCKIADLVIPDWKNENHEEFIIDITLITLLYMNFLISVKIIRMQIMSKC